MSTPSDPTPVDSLPDPASLLDHPEIDVETTEESVDAEEFAAAEAWTDHVVVYAASPAGDADLPGEVTSCQVESTDWYDGVPDDRLSEEMRDDLELLLE